MKRKLLFFSNLVTALAIAAIPVSAATEAVKKGQRIAVEADRRDAGFRDTSAMLEMILRDRSGRQSVRELRMMIFEIADQAKGDKTIVRFNKPRDIAGTVLLSYSHFEENDDQWLFLPALRRVKRISSSNKSGPFVGSEFSYEDIISQEHQRYRHRWLRDEPCGTEACFVVERVPKDRNSGYTRQVVFFDQRHYRPMRIDFYDRRNAHLKTLHYKDYHHYRGRYWRSHEMVMQNHQSGKSTILRFKRYEFAVGLKESIFRPNRLRTMR